MNELVEANGYEEPVTLGVVHIQVAPLLGIAGFPSHEGEEPQPTRQSARPVVGSQVEDES